MANYNYTISVSVTLSGNDTGKPKYGRDGAFLILVSTGTTASAANTNLSGTSVLQYCNVITGRTGTTIYKFISTASTCYAAVAAVRPGYIHSFESAKRIYTNQTISFNVTCNIGGSGDYLLSYEALSSVTPTITTFIYRNYFEYPNIISWERCALYTAFSNKYRLIPNAGGQLDTTQNRYYAASTTQFMTGTTWHAGNGNILEFEGYVVGISNSTEMGITVTNNGGEEVCVSVTIMIEDIDGYDQVILLGYYDYNVPAYQTANETIVVTDGMYHNGTRLGIRVREYNWNRSWQISLGGITVSGSGASEDYVMYNLSEDITIYDPIILRINSYG